MAPANKKSSGNKFNILVLCFIVVVVFSSLSLYALVAQHPAPVSDLSRNDLLHKTISSLEQEILSLSAAIASHKSGKNDNVLISPSSPKLVTSPSPPKPETSPLQPKNTIGRQQQQQSKVSLSSHNHSSPLATLHAVTYASHGGKDDRFCRAIESAVRHEVDLIILGWGVKWIGLSQKLEAAHAFAHDLPKDDIILFTDAFDVMFTNTPEHILRTYRDIEKESGSEIVFAGECGCWPHVTIDHGRPCFEKYPKAPTPYRYLNSGTWIGRADPSAAMLQAVKEEAGGGFKKANDQELVADMFMEGRFGISLDYHARLFQSMHLTLDKPLPRCKPIDDIHVVGKGQLHNKRTETYPAVFHFNGGGKRHHLDLEGKLWYKQSQYNTPEEVTSLREHQLKVPLPSDPTRTLRFDQICPGYFPGTGGAGGGVRQGDQFRRQERKTKRGRAITMKRNNREY